MVITREDLAELVQKFTADYGKLERELQKTVVGQAEAVRMTLGALILGGHVLLEGLPGTGKTHLGMALADVISLHLSRIQCTPDLMPTDITGTYVIMETAQGRRAFEFQKGPLFSNLVLADQINRTSPRTQAAMLEAMEQAEITVGTETFRLPEPFCVIATQNPLEMEGTYPLPEAQVDRFLFQVKMGMASPEEMDQIIQQSTSAQPVVLQKVVDGGRILKMREVVLNVAISDALRKKAIEVAFASQPGSKTAADAVKKYVRYGAGPRGVQALVLGAKFLAAVDGRMDVTAADLQAAMVPALRHRLILNFVGQSEGVQPEDILKGMKI